MDSPVDDRHIEYLEEIKASEQKLLDRAILKYYEDCYNLLNT